MTNAENTLDEIELSVVLPCLNEADTVGICIEKAQRSLSSAGIKGEVILADNGSKDQSIEIAEGLGARVVHVTARGYGNALKGGIQGARGRFVLMADADDSYDLLEVAKFIGPLREGADLVQGCRLPAGGGRVLPGSMPFSHRWIGNPMFSKMARVMFRAPIHDVYCGMRAFSKDLFRRLDLRCEGMEFATEMIIKASLRGANISEVPITLYPDGRKAHAPHLRTVRDGWRTLRFFLMLSPRWLFLYPGTIFVIAGLVGFALALPRITIGNIVFDAHTLLFSTLALLLGYQSILFGIFTKSFAVREGLLPADQRLERFSKAATLERGLAIGTFAFVAGVALLVAAVWQWWDAAFGRLDYARTMRWVIPGFLFAALGFQTVLASFFATILGLGQNK
jgi:glycosyltransferase involved in cell wall biosynthesis